MLEVRDLHVSYGPIPAVRGITFHIDRGEAVALLGRNGAGKTTTLRAIAGLATPRRGMITVDGRDLGPLSTARRAKHGLALTPEGRGMFSRLTVRDSLAMGAYHRKLGPIALRREIDRVTERFARLRERLDQTAGSLSGGEQQMLALARALMSAPKLLMLDEPPLGLAPVVVDQLYSLLRGLRDEGYTILLVEQYVDVALGFVDRAYVLDKGTIALEGAAAELSASSALVETYLATNVEEALT